MPGLYAYLINDPRDIEVTPAWDAPAYVKRIPESLDVPGGPLGHAWRHARQSGTIALGPRGSLPVSWRMVSEAAADAARRGASPTPAPQGPRRARLAYLSCIGANEPEADRALDVARNVAATTDAEVIVALEEPRTDDRVLAAVLAASTPRFRVCVVEIGEEPLQALPSADVTVVRGPGDDLDASGFAQLAVSAEAGPIAPLFLAADGTVASAGVVALSHGRGAHLLREHPVEDAYRLGTSIRVSGLAGPTRAWSEDRALAVPRTLLTLAVRTSRPLPPPAANLRPVDLARLVRPAGFLPSDERSASSLRRLSSAPPRWAIKTAAPAGPRGEAWGDTHFARALAAALRRQAVDAVVDSFPARHRSTTTFDDVTLVVRGPHRVDPPRGRSVLWIISHPNEITAEELEQYDLVFAASTPWAQRATERFGRRIGPLLQCTDVTRFRPSGAARDGRIVFVGTARGIPRPVVIEPIKAGIPVSVYGPDWRGYIPASAIAGTHVPNDQLARLYETAGVVLNDHWPAMRREGFISNRLFDVVAAGGRAISDEVEGIEGLFGATVRQYRSIPDLLGMLRGDLDTQFPTADITAEISASIRAEHSFDARARVLLDAVRVLG